MQKPLPFYLTYFTAVPVYAGTISGFLPVLQL